MRYMLRTRYLKYAILDEIYVKIRLPKICSKLIFKHLLLKLTTENTFMLTSGFISLDEVLDVILNSRKPKTTELLILWASR